MPALGHIEEPWVGLPEVRREPGGEGSAAMLPTPGWKLFIERIILHSIFAEFILLFIRLHMG